MNTKNEFLQKTGVVCVLALICTALWGSAFPCIKAGYALFAISAGDTASQIVFAGTRFFFAGILTILFGSIGQLKAGQQNKMSRFPLLLPKPTSIGKILILAMFQTVIQYVLFYIGLAHTSGVKGSILGGTSVLFSLLIACLIFHQETFTGRKVLGCIVGFAGVIFVNLGGGGLEFSFHFAGEGVLILSSLSYAFSSVFLKRFSKEESPVALSGYQFLVGGALMVLFGLFGGGRIHITSGAHIVLLLYMALISSVAYSVWGILLKHNPVSRITIYGCMTQIFGVFLSAILLKEHSALTFYTLIALICTCIGIIMVQRSAAGTTTKNAAAHD